MNVLIVDDESNIRKSMAVFLRSRSYTVRLAESFAEGLRLFKDERPDAAIVDIYLAGENGIGLLKEFLAMDPEFPTIVISGEADLRVAIDAVRDGAYDFIEKPVDPDRLETTLRNALSKRELELRVERLTNSWLAEHMVVGTSSSMKRALDLATKAAPTPLSVLIQGPTGSGKEIFARYIHVSSKRATGPFVAVNCSAIPAELFESELFGSTKGAFTGAQADRPGYFHAARGGTLFLDEIGELPLELQPKLLRAVESGEIRRVGATHEEKTDIRIIAATNRNLGEETARRRFREDLYYRIGQVILELPSLSERREDIPVLAEFFLKDCDQRRGLSARRGFSPELMRTLVETSWNGNVRELRNAVERGAFFTDEACIRRVETGGAGAFFPGNTGSVGSFRLGVCIEDSGIMLNHKTAREKFEKAFFGYALAKHKGSVKDAAAELGMLPNNLSRMLSRLDLQRPDA